jgi:hypothetical protein
MIEKLVMMNPCPITQEQEVKFSSYKKDYTRREQPWFYRRIETMLHEMEKYLISMSIAGLITM